MNKKRLFFALKPKSSLRAKISRQLGPLKSIFPNSLLSWTKPENLHITLQFLQQFPEEKLLALIEKAQAATKDIPCFEINLDKLQWFPSQEKAVVLAWTFSKNPQLMQLSSTLGNIIQELDYPTEKIDFRGHMTVGRLRRTKPLTLPVLPECTETFHFIVDKVYLIESKADGDNRNYTSVAELCL